MLNPSLSLSLTAPSIVPAREAMSFLPPLYTKRLGIRAQQYRCTFIAQISPKRWKRSGEERNEAPNSCSSMGPLDFRATQLLVDCVLSEFIRIIHCSHNTLSAMGGRQWKYWLPRDGWVEPEKVSVLVKNCNDSFIHPRACLHLYSFGFSWQSPVLCSGSEKLYRCLQSLMLLMLTPRTLLYCWGQGLWVVDCGTLQILIKEYVIDANRPCLLRKACPICSNLNLPSIMIFVHGACWFRTLSAPTECLLAPTAYHNPTRSSLRIHQVPFAIFVSSSLWKRGIHLFDTNSTVVCCSMCFILNLGVAFQDFLFFVRFCLIVYSTATKM